MSAFSRALAVSTLLLLAACAQQEAAMRPQGVVFALAAYELAAPVATTVPDFPRATPRVTPAPGNPPAPTPDATATPGRKGSSGGGARPTPTPTPTPAPTLTITPVDGGFATPVPVESAVVSP